jgi:hypothetical protein
MFATSGTGEWIASVSSPIGTDPRSSSQSSRLTVPVFSRNGTSNRFASPPMTWSRRCFDASACGSSRVLMIGRLNVVSSPMSFST